MSRFKKHLFFCVNERTSGDPKGSCAKSGASELLSHAKIRSHKMGMKGIVRVNKSGCLDACAKGPSVVVYSDDVWYAPRTKDDVEEILQEHIKNNRVVKRLVINFDNK